MPGNTYDPFKVYKFGEPELAERTDIISLTGQVQDYKTLKAQYAGTSGFKDPEFPHSRRSIGKFGVDSANQAASTQEKPIIWLRLKDALKTKQININGTLTRQTDNYEVKFSSNDGDDDATCRFDIIQGGIGNCYFVASLAALTTNTKVLKYVVPTDNNDDQGSGVYHFRFWRQGCWVDVVVDDYLPFSDFGWYIAPYGSGIRPAGSVVEMWVQLAEKAYAKLRGGYGNIASGGFSVVTLQELTGGLSEAYNLHHVQAPKKANYPVDLYEKMKGVLAKDSLIALSCQSLYRNADGSKLPDAELDKVNLKYDHAYTITKLETIKVRNGLRQVDLQLVRIRNPHGTNEFTGAFSDGSGNWRDVSEEEKKRIGVETKDDGEFWMQFSQMLKLFSSIQAISLLSQDEIKPPAVFEAYDGNFSSSQGNEFVINASNTPGNSSAYVIADVIAKAGRLSSFITLDLYSTAKPVPEYPPELAPQIEAQLALYPPGVYTVTAGGRNYVVGRGNPPIPQVEGVKDVQNHGGLSLCAAWKVPAGEYKIVVGGPTGNVPFTVRALYFK